MHLIMQFFINISFVFKCVCKFKLKIQRGSLTDAKHLKVHNILQTGQQIV